MYPKWHILWGAVFTALIWFFSQEISLLYLALIFIASFLIDFDHYVVAVKKTNKLSLKSALDYHELQAAKTEKEAKKGIRRRGQFHIFHTIEFFILVALLGFIWEGFFFVLIGIIFHSLLDMGYLLYKDRFYRREFFFFNWVRTRKS